MQRNSGADSVEMGGRGIAKRGMRAGRQAKEEEEEEGDEDEDEDEEADAKSCAPGGERRKMRPSAARDRKRGRGELWEDRGRNESMMKVA